MDIYTERPYTSPMLTGDIFDWDDSKAGANIAKHGVSFDYAARIFLDAARVDLDVSRANDGELRRKAVGMIEGRIFAVVYTERKSAIRIISARRCNDKESRQYGTV